LRDTFGGLTLPCLHKRQHGLHLRISDFKAWQVRSSPIHECFGTIVHQICPAKRCRCQTVIPKLWMRQPKKVTKFVGDGVCKCLEPAGVLRQVL